MRVWIQYGDNITKHQTTNEEDVDDLQKVLREKLALGNDAVVNLEYRGQRLKPSASLPTDSTDETPIIIRRGSVAPATTAASDIDAFLAHDWGSGSDNNDRDNHAEVACINKALQARGIRTWFDGDKMEGVLCEQMQDGIRRAATVVTFLTKRYIEKVGSGNDSDNCRREFLYAQMKKPAVMIAVPMHAEVGYPGLWSGPVEFTLGMKLVKASFAKGVNAPDFEAEVDKLANEIRRVGNIAAPAPAAPPAQAAHSAAPAKATSAPQASALPKLPTPAPAPTPMQAATRAAAASATPAPQAATPAPRAASAAPAPTPAGTPAPRAVSATPAPTPQAAAPAPRAVAPSANTAPGKASAAVVAQSDSGSGSESESEDESSAPPKVVISDPKVFCEKKHAVYPVSGKERGYEVYSCNCCGKKWKSESYTCLKCQWDCCPFCFQKRWSLRSVFCERRHLLGDGGYDKTFTCKLCGVSDKSEFFKFCQKCQYPVCGGCYARAALIPKARPATYLNVALASKDTGNVLEVLAAEPGAEGGHRVATTCPRPSLRATQLWDILPVGENVVIKSRATGAVLDLCLTAEQRKWPGPFYLEDRRLGVCTRPQHPEGMVIEHQQWEIEHYSSGGAVFGLFRNWSTGYLLSTLVDQPEAGGHRAGTQLDRGSTVLWSLLGGPK